MCFNAKTSLLTFTIGTIGSLVLIKYGNPKFSKENIVSGIFLLFIAGIQLMDFCFWIDLNNKLGLNKIVTILGPLINAGQPIIFYIIKLLYFHPKNLLSWSNFNFPILVLNILYFINLLIIYFKFLKNGVLTTGTSHGHLSWPWIKYANPTFYLILLAVNIFYFMNFKYALILFLILYLFLLLSVFFFSYNPAELWCFFGSFIPFLMFGVSYLL
jgi:hypothetical protein